MELDSRTVFLPQLVPSQKLVSVTRTEGLSSNPKSSSLNPTSLMLKILVQQRSSPVRELKRKNVKNKMPSEQFFFMLAPLWGRVKSTIGTLDLVTLLASNP